MFEIDTNRNLTIKTSAIFEVQENLEKGHSHLAQAAGVAKILQGAAKNFKKRMHLNDRHALAKSQKLLDTLRREAIRAQAEALQADSLDDLEHQLITSDRA